MDRTPGQWIALCTIWEILLVPQPEDWQEITRRITPLPPFCQNTLMYSHTHVCTDTFKHSHVTHTFMHSHLLYHNHLYLHTHTYNPHTHTSCSHKCSHMYSHTKSHMPTGSHSHTTQSHMHPLQMLERKYESKIDIRVSKFITTFKI